MPELEAIAGPAYLPYIRGAHAAFADVLGVTKPLTPRTTGALRKANRALARAIADYVRARAGEVDEDDVESVDAFRRAMYPLDAYRDRAFPRRRRASEPEPTPGAEPSPTPVPYG